MQPLYIPPPSPPLIGQGHSIYLAPSLPTYIPFPNGRRRRQIPASKPDLLPPASPPPQPRHLALHPRIHPDDLAQSQRGAAARREAHHPGQEEHECEPDEGGGDILCTCIFIFLFYQFHLPAYLPTYHSPPPYSICKTRNGSKKSTRAHTKQNRIPSNTSPPSSPPSANATSTALAATPASCASNP